MRARVTKAGNVALRSNAVDLIDSKNRNQRSFFFGRLNSFFGYVKPKKRVAIALCDRNPGSLSIMSGVCLSGMDLQKSTENSVSAFAKRVKSILLAGRS
jgi:hypothetical protein